ncbi:hypothetical protein EDD86DRAFT_219101 [Gorgonomyces haynaldii]|nr:hypothetical protein EDD86DRAFT_219101 [Gorgonomyces haynaldii]
MHHITVNDFMSITLKAVPFNESVWRKRRTSITGIPRPSTKHPRLIVEWIHGSSSRVLLPINRSAGQHNSCQWAIHAQVGEREGLITNGRIQTCKKPSSEGLPGLCLPTLMATVYLRLCLSTLMATVYLRLCLPHLSSTDRIQNPFKGQLSKSWNTDWRRMEPYMVMSGQKCDSGREWQTLGNWLGKAEIASAKSYGSTCLNINTIL